jgi:hypothetical protein
VFWIHLLPRWGKYRIRQELDTLNGQTAKVHRLVKVPLHELESWDATHDVAGQLIRNRGGGLRDGKEE